MSFLPIELVPYVKYAAPPVIGAFIGYLTNRIAIRMLFRPLREWRLFGIRVPMTPGVIPAKRHELAENMGEVVGDHLLTSKEIGAGLKEKKFQAHLLKVISERVGALLSKDLPSFKELVPQKFSNYVELGSRAIKHQVKSSIHSHINSDEFEEKVRVAVSQRLQKYLAKEVGEVLGPKDRDAVYAFVESSVCKMFSSKGMQQWLEEFVREQVYGVISQQKSLEDILPDTILELLKTTIKDQTPFLLEKLSVILTEEEVRAGVIAGVWEGIENFIESLGPMGAMAKGMLTREVVDKKVRELLDDKEEDIKNYLTSEEFQVKITAILTDRLEKFTGRPLVELLDTNNDDKVEGFCQEVSAQLYAILQSEKVSSALTAMVKSNIEVHLDDGQSSIEDLITEFFGEDGVNRGRKWIEDEVVTLVRSENTMSTIDSTVDTMLDALLSKRIGRLTRFLPHDVCDGIYLSIQKAVADLLEKEVPGVVSSLDIRNIVAEKLNSLDLLRLEGLLLSIMEEQFKYINLFGALLGFIIGCCNLLLMLTI